MYEKITIKSGIETANLFSWMMVVSFGRQTNWPGREKLHMLEVPEVVILIHFDERLVMCLLYMPLICNWTSLFGHDKLTIILKVWGIPLGYPVHGDLWFSQDCENIQNGEICIISTVFGYVMVLIGTSTPLHSQNVYNSLGHYCKSYKMRKYRHGLFCIMTQILDKCRLFHIHIVILGVVMIIKHIQWGTIIGKLCIAWWNL